MSEQSHIYLKFSKLKGNEFYTSFMFGVTESELSEWPTPSTRITVGDDKEFRLTGSADGDTFRSLLRNFVHGMSSYYLMLP